MSVFIKNSKILKSKTFHTTGIGEYFISTPEVVKSKNNLKFFFQRTEDDTYIDEYGTERALKKHTLSNGIVLSSQNIKDSQIYIVELKKKDEHKLYFFFHDLGLWHDREKVFWSMKKSLYLKKNYIGKINVSNKKIVIFDFYEFFKSEVKDKKNYFIKDEDKDISSISIKANIDYDYDELLNYIKNNSLKISYTTNNWSSWDNDPHIWLLNGTNSNIYSQSFPKIKSQKKIKFIGILDLNQSFLKEINSILKRKKIEFKIKQPKQHFNYDEDRIIKNLNKFYEKTLKIKKKITKDSVNKFHEIAVKNGNYDIYKFYFEMNEEYPNYGFCINLLKKKV